MFGTDYPYVTVQTHSARCAADGLSAADLAAIESGTALTLFPRFAKGIKP